jgi:hypothetical protein
MAYWGDGTGQWGVDEERPEEDEDGAVATPTPAATDPLYDTSRGTAGAGAWGPEEENLRKKYIDAIWEGVGVAAEAPSELARTGGMFREALDQAGVQGRRGLRQATAQAAAAGLGGAGGMTRGGALAGNLRQSALDRGAQAAQFEAQQAVTKGGFEMDLGREMQAARANAADVAASGAAEVKDAGSAYTDFVAASPDIDNRFEQIRRHGTSRQEQHQMLEELRANWLHNPYALEKIDRYITQIRTYNK